MGSVYRVVVDIDPTRQEVHVHIHARVPAGQEDLQEIARAVDAAREFIMRGSPELVRYTN